MRSAADTLAQLAGAVADDFVQRDHEAVRFHAVFCVALEPGGAGIELGVESLAGRRIEGAIAAGEKKILRSVFFVDLVFVGQIVADRGHAEIAGFDQRLDGFHYRQLE